MLARRGGGGEGGLYSLWVGEFQCTIYFVGRDVIEEFTLILLGEAFPIHFGSL